MNSLLNKYKPDSLDDFNISENQKKLINMYIENNELNLLITGYLCVGKSSLVKVILKKYYGSENIMNKNILLINLLKDQGINYYRNELNNYCQINNYALKGKKKTIIIEDIENLNENCQDILNTLMSKYDNINYIIVSINLCKIHYNLMHILEIINIKNTDNNYLNKVLNRILEKENLDLGKDLKDYIIKSSNFCVPIMINNLDSIFLIDKDINNININIVKDLTNNILLEDFNNYFKKCINKEYRESFDILININNKGYSVIDILDDITNYIKIYSNMSDENKYKIIKVISKYIYIFNDKHEDNIELIFFTNNIIKILNA
jgi:DNA polymerase III delta prime subunit